MKILLADDDQGMRDLMAKALSSDGHDVQAQSDGTSAAEAVGQGGYDLLIADIDMPGLDGVGVATAARSADPSIRIVLISAHDSELARAGEVPGGGVATLAKPFALDALRATLAKL